MISIISTPIDATETLRLVQSTRAGAVCLFLGTVREFTGELVTTYLEYEAYPLMAERKLAELEAQARARWPIIELAIVHRVGRLELGDVAVAVAVSTPHRAEAFAACQWIMDTLKEVVPIWKKERWANGQEVWIHPGLGLASPQ